MGVAFLSNKFELELFESESLLESTLTLELAPKEELVPIHE